MAVLKGTSANACCHIQSLRQRSIPIAIKMSLSIGSTIATLPQLPPVRTYGQRVERIKQAGSNLGKVCMQFQPFDYQRGRFQIAKSGVGLSLPVSRIDRRRPSLHSNGMQSVICAAALNVRCGAATAEQTQTVTQKSPTITHIPGKEKSPRLDDGGSGFPPYDCGGGGGGGSGGVVETFRRVDGSFLVFLVSLAF